MTEDDPIDPLSIDRLLQVGGQNLVNKMVGVFLKNGPKRLSAAQQGLANNDLSAVEYAVHSLKSSAGNYGAHALATLAGEIEEQATQGHAKGLDTQLQQLTLLYKQVENRLRMLLQEE
jgi:two-component system, sensor histidine kinase and response regulator